MRGQLARSKIAQLASIADIHVAMNGTIPAASAPRRGSLRRRTKSFSVVTSVRFARAASAVSALISDGENG